MKRQEYKRYLVQNCGESSGGIVSEAKESKWRKELERQLEVSCWKEPPRCVNDFMIGGDPEFWFSLNEARVASERLYPGLAFGADQNGRLGELRIEPSKSALDLVAGARKSLKWLRVSNAVAGFEYKVYCNPIVYFRAADRWDGVGGHVHFGRKSSEERRQREIKALDGLYRALVREKVWQQDECDARTARARYGRFGDSRIQKHGFEYRSFPSWLESPWKMFLVLTLAKLTVYSPSLPEWDRGGRLLDKIRLFLGYYQGMDDDARLARRLLCVYGLPIEGHGEVYKNWGLDRDFRMGEILGATKISVWPTTFEIGEEDKLEVFESLLFRKESKFEVPKIDWEPIKLPPQFVMSYENSNVFRVAGLGDLCCDTALWVKRPIQFVANPEREGIWISAGVVEQIAKGWREEFRKIGVEAYSSADQRLRIAFGDRVRTDPFLLQKVKRVLTSGLFPIWKSSEVQEDSWRKWDQKKEFKGISLMEE